MINEEFSCIIDIARSLVSDNGTAVHEDFPKCMPCGFAKISVALETDMVIAGSNPAVRSSNVSPCGYGIISLTA